MIVDRGYLDHWKTHALRQQTGLPNASELPLRLWEHCEARRDDFIADPQGYIVAGICRAQIEPKLLVKALVECRWLDKARGGYIVHGWRERNASWLNKINGGKLTAANSKRNAKGQLVSSKQQASSELVTSHEQASSQLAGHNRDEQVASSQLAGGRAGAVEWSGEEKRTATTPRAGAQARVSGQGALSETWDFILKLLSAKKRRAGAEAEHALARQAEALPLTEEQQSVLQWFYSLPHNERDIDLRGRFRDADKLAINLFAALERAEAYAQRNGGPQKKEGAAEPEGWRTWFAGKFPDKTAPADFHELPDYLQTDAWRDLGGGTDEGQQSAA